MKLVHIEWRDAQSPSRRHWRRIDDIQDDHRPLIVQSVGWLAHSSKESVVIVPHVSGEKNEDVIPHGSGEICIPRSNIVKMRTLKQPANGK